MKAIVNRMTAKQKNESMRMCRGYIRQGMEQIQSDIDCLWLVALRHTFGFGKRRLQRLYKALYDIRKEYMDFYESDGYDDLVYIAARQELHNIGIDIEDLRKDNPVLVETSFSMSDDQAIRKAKERHNER